MRGAALKPGDQVRITAPASPFSKKRFFRGVDILRSWELEPKWREDIFSSHRFLAGDDSRRLDELHEAFLDEKTKAIFFARGGYGSMRILDRIDEEIVRSHPKPLVGFSDNTALLLDLWERTGLLGLHAPMVASPQLIKIPSPIEEWYRRLLFSSEPPGKAPGFPIKTVVGGTARGPVIPGNFTIITHLLAAGRLRNWDGAILLLEEEGEAPYRVDRMFTALRLAGVLERIGGLVLGQFLGLEQSAFLDIIGDVEPAIKCPFVFGAAVGHGEVNVPVPVGAEALLDADKGFLEILESPVC